MAESTTPKASPKPTVKKLSVQASKYAGSKRDTYKVVVNSPDVSALSGDATLSAAGGKILVKSKDAELSILLPKLDDASAYVEGLMGDEPKLDVQANRLVILGKQK